MNSKAFHFDEERSQNCRAGSVTPPDSEATGLGYSFSKLALKGKNRSGMTLVEVMLAAAIMGIMSVIIIHALFYPRLLALSNTFSQQAILAGTDALEQAFSQSYTSIVSRTVNPVGKYVVNGRAITNVTTTMTFGPGNEYKRVTVTVPYPGGANPIVLETIRCNFPE